MKYVDEFRDGTLARQLAERLHAEVTPGRGYRLMEFCGGHTHAISRYGIADLLPPGLRLIHGPGCPVCVLPIGRVDMAIRLARDHGVLLCTYADTLRVPASEQLTLLRAKAQGADVRMVYSAADALALARQFPQRQVVFLAIGFETTTPATALVILQAAAEGIRNFSVLCCHVLTPPAIRHICDGGDDVAAIDGFIGPAHVSIIIGSDPYARFARDYRKPVVIAGFEPLDVLQAIVMLVRQINEGRAEVENEFFRAVTASGNAHAQAVIDQVFTLRAAFDWRGLGELPHSALQIRAGYAEFDAESRFSLNYQSVDDHKLCECGAILRGVKRPQDCRIFGTVCTPESAVGSCMVSSEGACAAHYSYGRFRDRDAQPEVQA